jgi:Ca2+-binding EF-hand superfamily protein
MKQVFPLLLALAFATGNAIASPQSHAHAHAAPTELGPAAAPAASDNAAKAFDALDANKDGQLSKAELATYPMAAHASMADADRNGRLSREEFTTLQKM